MNLRALSPLQLALGASIAVHGVLLTVRFVNPEGFNRVFQDTPLEVILVNARSTEKSDKAKAIAQATLVGGGDAAQGRATSPLPPSALMATGDSMEDAQRKMEAMQAQQTMLLAQLKKQIAALPAPDPNQPQNSAQNTASEEKRRQLIKLLAEIERRINEENSRPRKRYVSPDTREEVYAVYYDHLRHRIEDKGTEAFPELNGKKLYGELTMLITINAEGRIVSTEIVESSGNSVLDRRAQIIAQTAGPFGRFNAAMRQRADQLVVSSRFRFTRDETLETKLTSR